MEAFGAFLAESAEPLIGCPGRHPNGACCFRGAQAVLNALDLSLTAPMAPFRDRRKGATSGSALWRHPMIAVMAPPRDRRKGATRRT